MVTYVTKLNFISSYLKRDLKMYQVHFDKRGPFFAMNWLPSTYQIQGTLAASWLEKQQMPPRTMVPNQGESVHLTNWLSGRHLQKVVETQTTRDTQYK